MRKFLNLVIGLQVTIVFCLSFFSTFHYRQLYNDGANWAFLGLNSSSYHFDMPYLRFTTILNQLPAVFSIWLNASLPTTVWLFCFGYMIYPFIGLAVCYRIFHQFSGKNYFLIPILLLFFCIIPSWTFSVSVVNEAVVFGFILVSYVLAREKPNQWIVLSLAMTLIFSYEMGMLFYPSIIYLLWREKKINKTLFIGITLFILIIAYNLIFRLIPAQAFTHVSTSLMESFNDIWPYLPISFMLVFFDLGKNRWIKSMGLIVIFPVILFAMIYLYQKPVSYFWAISYFNRIWSIPASCLLILLAYEFIRSSKKEVGSFVLASLILMFVPSIYLESRVARDSVTVANRFRDFLSKNEGCVVYSREEWTEFESGTYIPVWIVPHLSLLFGESYKPRTILFTDIYHGVTGKLIENDFCSLRNREINVINEFATSTMSTEGKFDFSKIYVD